MKYLSKRVLSLLLALSLILAWIPASITSATEVDSRIADPATLNQWQDYFSATKLSTEFAGGVWTDKSVMTDASQFAANIPMNDPDNNFLIALSALAANQKIVGYSTAPIDVMLVVDVSGSMQGNKASTMVIAANKAIHSLLQQNNNNRVGMVAYSGNSNTSQVGTPGTATVILPLDRYTTSSTQRVDGENIPAYLQISNNQLSVTSGVRNSANRAVSASKGVSGGTYIQNGIYKAWQEFSKVTDTKIPAGQAQAGAQRTPIMVLLSDGQPTLATVNYTNIGNSQSTYGDGQEKNTTWRTVFLSQLTASWAKSKMAAHYQTNAKFYTLGLGTGSSNYATAVLNPSAATNSTLAGYWSNYFNPDKLGANNTVTIIDRTSWQYDNSWSILKDSAVTSKNYVDMYKLAEDTDELLKAFMSIVDSIELDAAGHVTLVEDIGEDMSGYITFTDELGMFMEVKDMKGLVLGNTLFTGAKFAQKLGDGSYGSMDAPTDLGNEFVRSVRERIGLELSAAQALVQAAYQDGQISYTSDSAFSNYLGWYSNDIGTYLGFWDKDTGITAEGAPAGATWINKSYLFQDAMNGSDMMHIVVLVATHIESGMQVIQYKIPASLIPKVTYEVELEQADPTQMKSLVRKKAFPLRLVYEVGLRDDVNPINVESKLQAAIAAGHGHAHKEADGSYAFYTNLWGAEHGDTTVDYTNPMNHEVAQSHFHPAVGNDRYYYTVDTPIYSDRNGTLYTGNAAPSGSGYYRAHHFYTSSGYTTEYIPVAAEALQSAANAGKHDDGYWYVPAGTVFQQIDRFKMHKTENTTGTLEYYDHPVVVPTADHYDTYAFLGNNGKVTLKPAQGIQLTKTVTETVDGASDIFTFDITLSEAVNAPAVTDADGNGLNFVHNGNVITVNLKAGETVYITNLPAGVTYTVTEQSQEAYIGTSANASGTVESGKINAVDFVNTPRGYGDLIVSKDVDHPFPVAPDALTGKEFSITVTLTGENVTNKQFPIAGTNDFITTDANGSFTVLLRDNESITVTNIPEGTTFAATENLDPVAHAGFTMDAQRSILSGTVVKDTVVQAHVVNVYGPQAPAIPLMVQGQKILTDAAGTFDWTGKSFTIQLEQYDPDSGTYTLLGQQQVTQGSLAYAFNDHIRLNQLGTYYFKVSEVIPEERLEGMSYDATTGRFAVTVTDNNVDGIMEIAVHDVDTGAQIGQSGNAIVYTKNFENIHTTDATYVEFTVQKDLVDPHNTGATEAGYLFELYEIIGGVTQATPAYSMRTVLVNGQGQAVFHIPVTKVGSRSFILKEIAPAEPMAGMTYDSKEYTVTVTGASANGKLEASVLITDAAGAAITEPVFTNVISLEPVVLTPGIHKVLEGREPLSDQEFTFTMTQTDGSFATPIPGGYADTVTLGEGNKAFREITISTVGTYYYRVVEVAGNAGGMHYDPSIYHITVQVTANGNQLEKQVSFVKVGHSDAAFTAQQVQFVNTYTNTATTQVTLQGSKQLTGRELLTGEFRFQLKDGDTVLQTVSNRADGSFVFEPITYTAADVGEHTYTVSEINDGKGGIRYDETVYTVTVSVVDNGLNELIATVTGGDNLAFANTYTAAPVTVSFGGTKYWHNTDLDQEKALTDGQFTFVLYATDSHFTDSDQQVTTATNRADGSFGFGLTYRQAGTYYYLLKEQNQGDATVGYDTSVYQIQIHVYDNGAGQLIGAVDSIEEIGTGHSTIRFENAYTPLHTQHSISGIKNLTGRALSDGEFTFRLLKDGELLQEVTNIGNRFAFAPLDYYNSGVYTYTVQEVLPEQAENGVFNGVAYDQRELTVTVTVTDVNGQLTATETVTYNNEETPLTFENTYTVTKFTDFDLDGEKWLYLGNAPISLGGREFRFAILDDAGNTLQTVTADANGKFRFENVPLTKTGLNTFTVKELSGNLGGIGYDTTVFTVTVDVADNGLGDLIAGLPVVNADLRFNNTYTLQPTTHSLQVQKVLENKTLKADQFSFRLFDDQGNILQTKQNNATGDVIFDAITYNAPGTYTYTISEVIPDGSKQGISYDTRVIDVTVTVTDNGDGTLSANAVYSGGPVFTNVYSVTGEPMFSLVGTKELTGRDPVNGEFTFVLSNGTNSLEADNVGTGFSFMNVKLPGLGKHTFTLTEKNTGKAGVTYDDKVYTVTVEVTDDGFGGMNVGQPQITLNGQEAEPVFTNVYTATPTEYTITATKQYNKDLTDGLFRFKLTGEGVSQTKGNVGQNITFDTLTFTAAGVYTYTVSEEIGNDPYITYDATVYTVVITVADDGLGQLSIESVTVNNAADTQLVFTNVFTEPDPASLELNIRKDVIGDLSPEGFQFELLKDGQVVSTVTADADGAAKITMDFTLEALGTHSFQLREVNTGVQHVTYDTHVYEILVDVTADADGKLLVAAQVDGEAVEKVDVAFVNTYDPPTTPTTGDSTNLHALVTAMGVSALGIVVLLAVLLLDNKRKPLIK